METKNYRMALDNFDLKETFHTEEFSSTPFEMERRAADLWNERCCAVTTRSLRLRVWEKGVRGAIHSIQNF